MEGAYCIPASRVFGEEEILCCLSIGRAVRVAKGRIVFPLTSKWKSVKSITYFNRALRVHMPATKGRGFDRLSIRGGATTEAV
jgi:hypothetical protein